MNWTNKKPAANPEEPSNRRAPQMDGRSWKIVNPPDSLAGTSGNLHRRILKTLAQTSLLTLQTRTGVHGETVILLFNKEEITPSTEMKEKCYAALKTSKQHINYYSETPKAHTSDRSKVQNVSMQ
jgi:hypothetical protein